MALMPTIISLLQGRFQSKTVPNGNLPEVKLEGDDGRAKQAWASARLAKTFYVPAADRKNKLHFPAGEGYVKGG